VEFLSASVKVSADTAGLTSGLARAKMQTSTAVAAMQRQFNSLNFRRAALAVVAFGTLVGGLGLRFVKAAADLVETQNKFDQVFKHLAGSMSKWADSFAADAGRSKKHMRDYLAQIQDTFVPMGFAREKAAEFSKQLTVLALDVASLNNKLDHEVLLNFQSAIVGNVRAVRKYGTLIRQVAIDQELLNMGLTKTTKTASVQELAIARFNIIMKSQRDAMGDVIRTKLTYINQLKRLQANIYDTEIAIGNKLLPAMSRTIILINEWITANRELIAQKVGDTFSALANKVIGAATAIKDNIKWIKILAEIGVSLYVFVKVVALFKTLKIVVLALGKWVVSLSTGLVGLASSITLVTIAGVALVSLIYKIISALREWDLLNIKVGIALNKWAAGEARLLGLAKQRRAEARKQAEELAALKKKWDAMSFIDRLPEDYIQFLKEWKQRYSETTADIIAVATEAADKARRAWEAAHQAIDVSFKADPAEIEKQVENARALYKSVLELEQKKTQLIRKSTTDQANAYIQMYDDMSVKGDWYWTMQKLLIDQEAEALIKLTGDMETVNQWRMQQANELFFKHQKLGQEARNVADDMESSMADSWEGILRGQKSIGEGFQGVMNSMVDSVYASVARMIAEWTRWLLFQAIGNAIGGPVGMFMGGMGGPMPQTFSGPPTYAAPTMASASGVHVFHQGGVVGGNGPKRMMSDAVFAGARRMHSGGVVGSDEEAIIAKKGEVVSPAGAVAPTINLSIHAVDARSVSDLFLENSDALAEAMSKAISDNNPYRR